MKIDILKLRDEKIEKTIESRKMRLSENASAIIFQIFTRKLYSNPIGSIVREITSNAVDSHKEAGVSIPVVIRYSYDSNHNTHFISFIDFGVGMSPERINEVYTTYFESTKRDSNLLIGGFGIGGKTPLAYRRYYGSSEFDYDNSYYIITIYNKIKYYYLIYEGTDSPEITLLNAEPTDEHNGTEVRIPVLEKDVPTFAYEMKKQLYYFDNVVFEGFENFEKNSNYSIGDLNDYKIIKGKTFLYRGNDLYSHIHVCLGNVAYPIDYSILKVSPSEYYFPVAIKLNIGDVDVTTSREQLDYNEKTIKTLKKKLNEVIDELKEIVAKQNENIVTLEDYFLSKEKVIKLGENSFDVSILWDSNDINLKNFKYNNFIDIIDKHYLIFPFLFDYKIYVDKKRNLYLDKINEYSRIVSSKDRIYFLEKGSKVKRNVISYLRSQHKYFFVLRKIDNINFNEIINKTNHLSKISAVYSKHNKNDIVNFYAEFQNDFFEIIKKYCKNINNVTINTSINHIKVKRNYVNLDEDVIVHLPYLNWGQIEYKKTVFTVKDIINFRGKIFYGFSEDKELINKAFFAYKKLFDNNLSYNTSKFSIIKGNNRKILFAFVSKNIEKYLKLNKNAFHVKFFTEKLLYRAKIKMLDYYWQNQFTKVYNKYFKEYYFNMCHIMTHLKDTAPDIYSNLNYINEFANTVKQQTYLDEYEFREIYPYIEKLCTKDEIESYKVSSKYKELFDIVDEVKLFWLKKKKYFDLIDFSNERGHEDELSNLLKYIINL